MHSLRSNGRNYIFQDLCETVSIREYKEGHSNSDDFAEATRDDKNNCWNVEYSHTLNLKNSGFKTTKIKFSVTYSEAKYESEIAAVMAKVDYQMRLGRPS